MILQDKVVIVSGIGPGLGQELAFGAAREGARLVLAARTEGFLEKVDAKVREAGADSLVVPTDISDRAACARLVEAAISRYGRVDSLINSAYASGKFMPFEMSDLDDWRNTMNVNLFGSLGLAQEVIPHMKKQGGGSIVNVNTMAHRKPMPMQGGYATSKGALATATKIMATELGAHGIRVNSVYPGWMWGPPVEFYVNGEAKRRGVEVKEVVAEIAGAIPLGHIPDDADCANAVLFFASDLSSAITGASLDVNGGEFMP